MEDLDGNGFPDLAVSDGVSRSISILLNDGIWPGPQPSPGGTSPAARSRSAPLDCFAARTLANRHDWMSADAVMPRPLTSAKRMPFVDSRVKASVDERVAPMPVQTPVPSRQALDEWFTVLNGPAFFGLLLIK
jgi:hypothetical protein